MKDNAIGWIMLLTAVVALGLAALVAYDMMNTVVEGYFFS